MAEACRRLARVPQRIFNFGIVRWRSDSFVALDLLLGSGRSILVGAWDISEDVSFIYDCVHGSFAPVHLGQRNGDILATDIREFPSANAVIGGPYCPPFSSVGKPRALADERLQPFTRCIDAIV